MGPEDVCPECGFSRLHADSWWQQGDPLVTIIAFWPVEEWTGHKDGYEPRQPARAHLRTACAHAHYNLQIIEHPAEAILPPGVPIVCLEEPYEIEIDGRSIAPNPLPPVWVQPLEMFEHPENATYILGNSDYQRPSEHFQADHLLGVTLDDPSIASYSPLYADQVVPLIWYDRRLKSTRQAEATLEG